MPAPAIHPPRTARHLARLLAAGALVSVFGLVTTNHPAQAAGYAVTITADGGAGSLRDAIDQANANPGPDTISVPAGTYTLTIAGNNEDSNATGDLDIGGDLTITGAGAGLTIIDADGLDRVFDVQLGTVTLEDMTITGGDVGAGAGGNVIQRSFTDLTIQDAVVSNGSALSGGGIASSTGDLTILRSEIIDNQGVSIQGNGASGAAISKGGQSNATFVMTDSLVAGNVTTDGNGAVYIGANATVTNTTITGNQIGARAVYVENYGSTGNDMVVDLVHLTIAGNTTTGNVAGLGLYVNLNGAATLTVTLEGSLIQDNDVQGNPNNCALGDLGTIVSGGNNVADDASCFLTQPSDSPSDNGTTLSSLADHGGPTRTLALVAGSSAIDAAGACGVVTPTDQRGVSRPAGPACDAGAYEFNDIVEESTTSSTSTTSTSTTSTTIADTTTSSSTTTTDLGSGGNGTTTTQLVTTTVRRNLPSTGGDPSGGLWLATLATCLGGLLILGARRLAR